MKTTLQSKPVVMEDELAVDRMAFQRQRAQLMRRYPGEYVALRGGRLVGHDKNDEALAARMFAKFGETPFYIARPEESPTIYEIPSPELAA